MNMNCIINYLQSANGIGLILNLVLGAVMLYFTQIHKRTLDIEVEKYKKELQVEFIKAEMKAKQLFIIYTTMYSKFVSAESSIIQLKSPELKRQRDITQKDMQKTETILINSNDYLAHQLLFFSDDVSNLAIKLKDIMFQCLYCEDTTKLSACLEKIQEAMQLLKYQMQKELILQK